MVFSYIMDEFSLQETHRFQNQEMVEQIGAWVFQGTDDAPGRAGRMCYSLSEWNGGSEERKSYLCASTRAWEALSSV